MITGFILTVVSNFLLGLFILLPEGHLPSDLTDSIGYFWAIFNSFSYIIPVSTVLTVLALVLSFELVLLLWSMVHWIIRKIPGIK